MKSETPETDECAKNIDQTNFEEWYKDSFEDFAWVPTDFARKLEIERNHWKANHDNILEMRRALLDRPDLGERAKLVVKLIEERDEYKTAFEKSQEALAVEIEEVETLRAELNGLNELRLDA